MWLPASQYEAVFLGTAHAMEDIQQTVASAREAFATFWREPEVSGGLPYPSPLFADTQFIDSKWVS